ncbi:4Fe-4S binding protein [Pyrobaculum ferrireducens]|uniref:Ferredoxin oxidoreductase, conjectural n=1 Tax=Pyrobaculum ferrireducens TaxID=1104324 RepID=G7VHI3_9CREN|nr:4Fe-4S binding protein [Pyrobaculum ferrireducens]AET33274.1 ferredoxin oxidoreductase, conjectural [Pyrobaculum ferrireducens]
MEKVVIYRDSCIACGACIVYCPHGALIPDEDGKPILLWDLCKDDFACVYVCPVAAVQKTSQASKRPLVPWYRLQDPAKLRELEAWLRRLGSSTKPSLYLHN